MDPNNPNNSPGDDSLGFTAEPKQEKYNTQFLTANLKGERRTTQLIAIGVVVATVLGLALWFGLGASTPPAPAPEVAAPAAPAKAGAPDAATAAKEGETDAVADP